MEGFFAKLTRRRLKHGVFHSVVDLQAAINRFVREYHAQNPAPFVWKANPDDIIAARKPRVPNVGINPLGRWTSPGAADVSVKLGNRNRYRSGRQGIAFDGKMRPARIRLTSPSNPAVNALKEHHLEPSLQVSQ